MGFTYGGMSPLDTVLFLAVLMMLISSTYMGFAMKRSLYHSQKAFDALTESMKVYFVEIDQLKDRLEKLELERR
jgi:hypothetical protein